MHISVCRIIGREEEVDAILMLLPDLDLPCGTRVALRDNGLFTLVITAPNPADSDRAIAGIQEMVDVVQAASQPRAVSTRKRDTSKRIIQTLADSPQPLSRRQLANRLGVKYDTVSLHIGRFLASGVVTKAGRSPAGYQHSPAQLYRLTGQTPAAS
jgi:DNA-binding transcriptional ArsR family regulator